MPKVTVILTSYNHAKYIRETIDSILNQTFKDFELISSSILLVKYALFSLRFLYNSSFSLLREVIPALTHTGFPDIVPA